MRNDRKVVGIAGWKDAGKTTLLAGILACLVDKGFTVSTIKHAHHAFDIDHQGRDSWHHRAAGATETAIVSQTRWALMHELRDEREPALSDMVAKLAPCDIVLVEGFKTEPHPKIEVMVVEDADTALWTRDNSIIAVAADTVPEGCGLPYFKRDQYDQMADFIIDYLDNTPTDLTRQNAG